PREEPRAGGPDRLAGSAQLPVRGPIQVGGVRGARGGGLPDLDGGGGPLQRGAGTGREDARGLAVGRGVPEGRREAKGRRLGGQEARGRLSRQMKPAPTIAVRYLVPAVL